MNAILKYFPDLSQKQIDQFEKMKPLYEEWNAKVNVISRKDMDNFYTHHVLHSLAIAKLAHFKNGSKAMDLGSGGGFPGIPLAIYFPEVDFLLVDSIRKKTLVIVAIAQELGLKNVRVHWGRAEEVEEKFNYITCRAVAKLSSLLEWSRDLFIDRKIKHTERKAKIINNGLWALKGGNLDVEIKESKRIAQVFPLSEMYEDSFFNTKSVLYLKQ